MAEEKAAREWLGRRDALYKAERASARLLKRQLVPSSSLLSAAPELIRINDPEENPLKVLRFHEKRLGVSALVEDDITSKASFQSLSKEELYQSFALEKVPSLVEESVLGSPRSRTSEPNTELVHGLIVVNDTYDGSTKRCRLALLGSNDQGRSRSSSPVPSTIGPTIEATSPSATPAKSPTTQLPSEIRNAANVSNQSVGPSPPRKGSISTLDPDAMVKECTYIDSMTPELLGEPLVSKSKKGQFDIPPRLMDEYDRILTALENIEWPVKVQPIIKAFRRKGMQNGNPFIDIGILMPKTLENMDALPSLDLKTVRQRINDQTHYRYFYMLEQDLRDMCSLLKKHFADSATMSVLVSHFSSCVENEVQASDASLKEFV